MRRQIREAPNLADVRGFQFAVVRAAGHDDSEEPEVLYVSTYQAMNPVPPDFLRAA